MAIDRYSTQPVLRNDVLGNITPNNIVQDNDNVPAGEWRPAPWLPVIFVKSDRDSGESPVVISACKPVAQDSNYELVPAGLRAKLVGAATSTTVLTYTENDYNWKVVDLVTGAAVATSSGASYTCLQVAQALVERGLVDGIACGAAVPPTSIAHCTAIIEAFISKAIGIARYDIYASAYDVDGKLKFHNFTLQENVQFLTATQIKVAHRTVGSDTQTFAYSVTPTSAVSGVGDFPVSGEVWAETALDDITRYASAVDGKSVVAYALQDRPIAKNTTRTPFSCDYTGMCVKEKTSISAINSEGDYYIDYEEGIVFVHSDVYDDSVAATTNVTFTYYYYDITDSTNSSSQRYPFFDGICVPGAFISYDVNSNYVVMASSEDALGASNTYSIGRLHKVIKEPVDHLEMVKTAWDYTNMGATGRMPGTATSGYSDMITLATSESIADELVLINIRA